MVDLKNHYIVIGFLKGHLDKVYVTHDYDRWENTMKLWEALYDITPDNREARYAEGTEVYRRVDEGRVE